MSIRLTNAPAVGGASKITLLKAADFSFGSSTSTITSSTYTSFASLTFTPTLINADIFVEVYAAYNVNGGNTDDWYSNITWNGGEIGYQHVQYNSSTGGAGRSSALFPVVGSWYNVNRTPYILSANAKRGTSDDTLTIQLDNSFYIKITETVS
jgi:hypothetical protein